MWPTSASLIRCWACWVPCLVWSSRSVPLQQWTGTVKKIRFHDIISRAHFLFLRNTSLFDRYGEGRKLWTSITVTSRNLANLIWIHVSVDRDPKDKNASITPEEDRERKALIRLKAVLEKKTMINLVRDRSSLLCLAFFVCS